MSSIALDPRHGGAHLLSTWSRSRPRSRYSTRERHHARVGKWIRRHVHACVHVPPAATTHESCVAAACGSSSAARLRDVENPARERVGAQACEVSNGRVEGGGSSRAAAAQGFARAAAAAPPGDSSVEFGERRRLDQIILRAERARSLPAGRRGRAIAGSSEFLIEASAAAPSRAAAEKVGQSRGNKWYIEPPLPLRAASR